MLRKGLALEVCRTLLKPLPQVWPFDLFGGQELLEGGGSRIRESRLLATKERASRQAIQLLGVRIRHTFSSLDLKMIEKRVRKIKREAKEAIFKSKEEWRDEPCEEQ